jgi:SAM-dependent methyltransferase
VKRQRLRGDDRQRRAVLGSLSALEAARAPFASLTAAVVGAVVRRYVPEASAAPLAEIGAGDGQLRRWLPAPLHARTTHTEILDALVARLHQRHPDAHVARADAVALPFPSGSLAAVVGLCVLDDVAQPARVRDEIRRVLVPGGVVIHFLDLSTNPSAIFAELDQMGEVPLPNFFVDLALSSPGVAAQAPACGPLDDLLAAPRDQLAFIAGALRAAGHAMAAPLLAYLAPFSPDVFEPSAAAAHFTGLLSDPRAAAGFRRALSAIYETVRRPSYRVELPLDLRPLASHSHFERRLRDLFAAEHGFDIEVCDLLTARSRGPRAVSGARGVGFIARYAGWGVTGLAPPAVAIGSAADPGGSADRAPGDLGPGDLVTEVGVQVLVARATAG